MANETQNQNTNSDALNFAIPENGFGTYLKNILPEDQRVLAGAFSVAMQQIKNINQVQAEKFAQAAYSTENMFGLNLVNGTDVPTDQMLAKISQTICALGGGVYGTYTMSNFFGCMSGLPYPLREIYDGIKTLDDSSGSNQVAGSLRSIYQNLYLAVTWERATTTVVTETQAIETSPGVYTWQYRITDITINHNGSSIINIGGGGYQRGNTPSTPVPPPNGTWGGTDYAGHGSITVECLVGDNPQEVSTLSTVGNFGRVYTLNKTNFPSPWYTYKTGQASSTPTPPDIQFIIDEPPTTFGGSGWSGSPNMNDAVQHYINEANTEIQAIQTSSASNFELANILNTNWLILGKALKQEQRARYISNSPVPIPFDQWLAMYPQSLYTFVDAIPGLGGNTLPHMYAQTLENISDLNLVGGQSIIGLMRESRNQQRLNNAGLVLENNLANDLSLQDKIQLITNNTLPDAIDGINGYTIPAFSDQAVPVSYYDPCLPGMMCYNEIQYVETNPISTIMNAPTPEPEVEPPASPTGYVPPPSAIQVLPSGTDVIIPDTTLPCEGSNVAPIYGAKPAPVATGLVGIGSAVPCDPPTDYPLGVNKPKNIIPPELDAEFTSSGLSPSAPTVQQAIDQVIACNCDCWVV